MSVTFRAVVELGGKTATGLEVPDEAFAALDGGKRPAVTVTVGGHSYRSTVGTMGGRHLIPLSAEHRRAAGVEAGDEIEVTLDLDTAPRVVEVPEDLSTALAGEDAARTFFDGLSYTHRKEWVRWITEAKKPETRTTRVARTIEALRSGQRTR